MPFLNFNWGHGDPPLRAPKSALGVVLIVGRPARNWMAKGLPDHILSG